MKRTAPALGALILLALCIVSPAGAQELQPGTWTGVMSPPGGEGIPVTFAVGMTDGALSIVMDNAQLGEMPFTDAQLAGDELTFWWEPGTRVDCTLVRQEDRSFEGTCSAGNGDGTITMVPPSA